MSLMSSHLHRQLPFWIFLVIFGVLKNCSFGQISGSGWGFRSERPHFVALGDPLFADQNPAPSLVDFLSEKHWLAGRVHKAPDPWVIPPELKSTIRVQNLCVCDNLSHSGHNRFIRVLWCFLSVLVLFWLLQDAGTSFKTAEACKLRWRELRKCTTQWTAYVS